VFDKAAAEARIRKIGDAISKGSASHDGAYCLSLANWLARDIPPPDFLLGEILSTTSRALLSAPTGLGKTNFVMAMGISMAAGVDFLHWRARRCARVLFIDGEMSRRLIRARLADAVRRLGQTPESFFVLCRDDVPDMPPLNTPEGQSYIDRTIEHVGGVDFIIFDNVMSLITGDMKDEESWQDTLPWIKGLTKRSIGQAWIHHTGYEQSHGYGTSTREWQLDTVGLMQKIERPGTDIAFSLNFNTKARERAPHNRADFEPVVINLAKDQWAVETNGESATAKKEKPPSPKGQSFHKALCSALVASGRPRSESINQPSVTMDEWQVECVRKGLIDRDAKDNQKRALISKYRLELIGAKWIACADEMVWNRTVAR
jgi:hypothetical protein